jgi:hypothetical protein
MSDVANAGDVNSFIGGKFMQFVKEVGGKLIVAIVIGACGFLWGVAENKGAFVNKVDMNIEQHTRDISILKADVKELQLLRVDISDLRGDIKALNATLNKSGVAAMPSSPRP